MQETRFSSLMSQLPAWGASAAMLVAAGWIWFDQLHGKDAGEATALVPSRPLQLTSPGRAPVPPPFDAYRAFTERPLFHPSRKPFPQRSAARPAAAVRAAPAHLPPPRGFILRGTIISGPVRSAVFERAGEKDYVRVAEGGQLEGWTLVKITRSEIVLRASGRELSMTLQVDGGERSARPSGLSARQGR